MEQELIYEKKDGVAVLTLNRPQRLNALSPEMFREVAVLVEAARVDDEVKVLIFTGAASAFCAGADMAGMAATAAGRSSPPPASRAQRLEPRFTAAIHNLPKLTIAAVNGVAAGGGLALALACDLRIASERARFSSVFVRRGLVPDMGTTYFLPRVVGHARAALMMLTGDEVDAREAERIGLVSQVVPHEELMPTALALAGRLARGPSVTLELTKRALQRSPQSLLEAQMDFELYANRICHDTEDYKEGIRSFMEKREPQFRGE